MSTVEERFGVFEMPYIIFSRVHMKKMTEHPGGAAGRGEYGKRSATIPQGDISFEVEPPYNWQGRTINLSAHGTKVNLPASAIRLTEGMSVPSALFGVRFGRPRET